MFIGAAYQPIIKCCIYRLLFSLFNISRVFTLSRNTNLYPTIGYHKASLLTFTQKRSNVLIIDSYEDPSYKVLEHKRPYLQLLTYCIRPNDLIKRPMLIPHFLDPRWGPSPPTRTSPPISPLSQNTEVNYLRSKVDSLTRKLNSSINISGQYPAATQKVKIVIIRTKDNQIHRTKARTHVPDSGPTATKRLYPRIH